MWHDIDPKLIQSVSRYPRLYDKSIGSISTLSRRDAWMAVAQECDTPSKCILYFAKSAILLIFYGTLCCSGSMPSSMEVLARSLRQGNQQIKDNWLGFLCPIR